MSRETDIVRNDRGFDFSRISARTGGYFRLGSGQQRVASMPASRKRFAGDISDLVEAVKPFVKGPVFLQYGEARL